MEVFHCDVPSDKKLPDFDGPNESKAEAPEGLEACRQVIGAWAMGAEPLTYPEEAGAPIGGSDYSRYVMLEIHYNNPDHKQGVIDSSGIKFYVTKNLRKYDAGTLEIGLEYTDKMALPPGLPIWNLIGYCVSECTKVSLPDDGIKVFASQLHTHLTGRKTYTRHYRNGIELPNLNRDNHYSPHYQEIRRLQKPVTVLPGDVLVHVCVDRTSNLENVTLGGFSISDEMCVNYMHYYPRTALEVCKSSVTTQSLYGFFKFMNVYNRQDTSPDIGISDNYKSIDWSPLNVQLLQTYYDTAPLSMQCNRSDGARFPGVEWEGMPVPTVELPRAPDERPCLL
ncbi:hypothetical protein LSH36_194g01002 [Paralvinella palmiformis]|uniref:Uncharacterized protein n=1 Tax=Paralvinella palmiformis TaxID=53620 RepID=A0AAD9N6Y6_9ANNE|nr:hypothetical protein LSH36_194g01002 [Paralvinella palmiformis]